MRNFLLSASLLFTAILGAQPVIVINEVDADNPSTDTMEFIELKTETANMSLDGYVIVLYNGSDNQSYESYGLDGYSSNVNGLFVIGTSIVSPTPDYILPKADNNVQNGADAVAVYQDDASNFPNDTPITTTNLIDAFVYDTNDSDDVELLGGLGVSVQYNEDAAGDKDNHSNQRKADGTYEAKGPTPGALNDGGGVIQKDITITTTNKEYNEGDSFDITFTTSENVGSDLVINYTLVNGSFDASDYTGNLSATIISGSSSISTTIAIVNDTHDEGNEVLIVKYNNLDADYQAINDNYEIDIIDDDFATSAWGTPLNPTYDVITSTAAEDYYQSLEGKSGQDLKDAITAIISNTNVVRAQTYGDVWDMVKEADVNPENNNEVWLLYTEQGRAKTDQQGSSAGVGLWNREHIYPQSRGGFEDGTSTAADGKDVFMTTDATHIEHGHSDAHSLRPADSGENSSRSNRDFGDDYDGPVGNAGSWKGDVARSVMYMALRYNVLDVVVGDLDNTTVGELGDLTYLLTWHSADIPDDYEMNRNNIIYDWQKNRNPFIDMPNLVDYVYGDKIGQVWNSSLSIVSHETRLSFYPNPIINEITFESSITGNINIISLEGKTVFNRKISSKKVDLSVLKSGIYLFEIRTNTNIYKGKIIKK